MNDAVLMALASINAAIAPTCEGGCDHLFRCGDCQAPAREFSDHRAHTAPDARHFDFDTRGNPLRPGT